MNTGDASRVLAIGIDAAESTLVRQLIDRNEMPVLKALLKDGQWLRVLSPAPIGSGAVWPTFTTRVEPTVHGIYSEWSWQPDIMALTRFDGRDLTPFWKEQADQNIPVGTFDVPFALPVGISKGFEVSEWWAHDPTGAGLQVGPDKILSLVEKSPAHPLSASRFVTGTPNSQTDLSALADACMEGVRLRGELARSLIKQTTPRLALIVFPEIHHAAHQMWHAVEPHHRIYSDRQLKEVEPLLKDLYRTLDTQIGALIDSTGSWDSIFVFALHGMRPGSGSPAFLAPLLSERGFARLANWSSQSWRNRALSLFAMTKRHTPETIKNLYYKLTPTHATHKLARPTMLPLYDWVKTRAFSLPTDQHGWIRINLIGRETKGIVPLDQYDDVCKQLKKLLLSLRTEDDQPLVRDIVSTASNTEHALSNPLPDLVVHWGDAAFTWPLKIQGSNVQVEPLSRKSTGQHASEGFCIYRGNGSRSLSGVPTSSDVVNAKDLGRLITQSLN